MYILLNVHLIIIFGYTIAKEVRYDGVVLVLYYQRVNNVLRSIII